ncbi:uracil-DNA glycosylase [Undibacterium sp. Jales W-56]|uniref:uracil-DNA glycosylase n=1 Tax=Undibacterium sp. Jales W-56 TaxID=2897325 RepID=UPI0021CEF2D9|nr:uracil-DNA glycosylase [Undibacterium sp. Jales W-56]MCU6433150.1 uracil-DNA glycosylase [Undibacterium sp. Jales W-56]
MQFPAYIEQALTLVDPSWIPALRAALSDLHKADPAYLLQLEKTDFLPESRRLFAAFALPVDQVRYVLIGEGPYPRAESATGFCFMDGAVKELWSHEVDGGLSKKVNRATSLRNFIKMLLVAEGYLTEADTSIAAMSVVAQRAKLRGSGLIQTLPELQQNLLGQGFLLLNASLIFRSDVAPVNDAKAWQPFLQSILTALNQRQEVLGAPMVRLVLWGKIAEQLKKIPVTDLFLQEIAEHPYNLSFICNRQMQSFFKPLHLLQSDIERTATAIFKTSSTS